MSIQGRVEKGAIVLDDSVTLPEGALVEIEIVSSSEHDPNHQQGMTLYERLKDVVGIAGGGLPTDFAEQHDHYAHGTPKQ